MIGEKMAAAVSIARVRQREYDVDDDAVVIGHYYEEAMSEGNEDTSSSRLAGGRVSIESGSAKRVIVTGASSGLGRALAVHYAACGWTVGAMARRAGLLDELAREYPGRIVAMAADVTDGEATEQAIHRFNLEEGGLDLIYVNAGIGQSSPEDGWDADRARRIAEVNVVGATNTIAPAATIMVEQGHGRIVGISSLAGWVPLPSSAAYGASKGWMVFYLRSLDMDLREAGVRCSVVMPGYLATPMVDDDLDAKSVSQSAKRAAAYIAVRVANGDGMIRFPRRVAMLSRLSGFLPSSLRMRMQRKRLAKRKRKRSEG